MTERHLEDFRLNQIFETYLMIMSLPDHPRFEMTYNTYSIHGFYNTSDDLNDLENSKNYINNGRKVLPCILLWFLALESFINSLCKVASLIKDDNFKEVAKQDLSNRLTYAITSLTYNEVEIKKSGIYNRINEFKTFRNELFHDRNIGSEVVLKKTNFSTNPILSNQVDVFQSLIIYLEVALLFRFSIPGLDLMPNISIGNSNIFHFDKLDTLYKEYLVKYLQANLNKHGLTTKLDLSIDQFPSLPPSTLFSKGEVVVIGRVEQEEKFKHPLNQTDTSLGRTLYHNQVKSYNLPDGHTGNLNFVVDWPDLYQSKFPMRK